jgi:DNA-binding NtrC family response regulator
MTVLCQYEWPGNVRELRNLVLRAVVFNACELSAEFVQRELRPIAECASGAEVHGSLPQRLADMERSEVDAAMRLTGGNKTQAVRLLGISRNTLKKKLKRYGLQ